VTQIYLNWGVRKKVKKGVTHNKRWCPNSCGKRVTWDLQQRGGHAVMVYTCPLCNTVFSKEQMLEFYGKAPGAKL
jgi:hypothetical protein